ncbi:MAG: hypothetical protein ACQKBY_05435 [Verrucomicrobiales bacterium]
MSDDEREEGGDAFVLDGVEYPRAADGHGCFVGVLILIFVLFGLWFLYRLF